MQDLLTQAIQALNIDVPVLNWTIQNGKVTLLLYGGQVRVWKINEKDEAIKGENKKKKQVA
jgi:predicted phage tail protein